VEKKDVEVKRKAIIKELEYISYNTDYKGTNYLIDTILQVYRNKNLIMENLQKDVYPIISDIYKKSVNTIRCNIRRATECMYCECDIKKLNEYFGIIDDERPSTAPAENENVTPSPKPPVNDGRMPSPHPSGDDVTPSLNPEGTEKVDNTVCICYNVYIKYRRCFYD